MTLKLKDQPSEWRKFAWTGCVAAIVVVALLYRANSVGTTALQVWIGLVLLCAVAAALRPQLFGGPYRVAMRLSFRIGLVVQAILLSALFLLLITPLSWLLRLGRKDLLNLRVDLNATSYWRPCRKTGKLDQQF